VHIGNVLYGVAKGATEAREHDLEDVDGDGLYPGPLTLNEA